MQSYDNSLLSTGWIGQMRLLKNEIKIQTWIQNSNKVWNKLQPQVRNQIWYQVEWKISDQVQDYLRKSLK